MEEADFFVCQFLTLKSKGQPTPKHSLDSNTNCERSARSGRYDEALVAELDKAVFKLYGLDRFEQILVEDMVNCTIDLQRNHENQRRCRQPPSKNAVTTLNTLLTLFSHFLRQGRNAGL